MKNNKQNTSKDKRKHNNERNDSYFTLPSNVIPPNFGNKSKKKLR